MFFCLAGGELGSAVGCEQSLGLTLCLSSAFFTESVMSFAWQEQLSGQSYFSSVTQAFLAQSATVNAISVPAPHSGCSHVSPEEFSDALLALGQLWG